jgi:hypothetical protein
MKNWLHACQPKVVETTFDPLGVKFLQPSFKKHICSIFYLKRLLLYTPHTSNVDLLNLRP